MKAAQKREIPVLITLHQLPWFVTKYCEKLAINVERILWRYGRWFLTQCAASIVLMPQIAAIVREHTGCDPQIIPYGADLKYFKLNQLSQSESNHLRRKYELPEGIPILLHVGRLDIDKGVNYVIDTAAKVLQEREAILLVIGDGCKREALTKRCQDLGIIDFCRFTGYIGNRNELAVLYRLSDVFITASEIETFGIVILEAMAAACPVVAVNATCIPELVMENQSGFLLPPGDINGLSSKVIWLLDNPKKARVMGLEGKKISMKYDQERMLNKHLQLYRNVQDSQKSRMSPTLAKQVFKH